MGARFQVLKEDPDQNQDKFEIQIQIPIQATTPDSVLADDTHFWEVGEGDIGVQLGGEGGSSPG